MQGVLNGMRGNHLEAIKYFEKVTQLDPKNASAFMMLGNAFRNAGDNIKGDKYVQMANQLDPEILKNQSK